MLQLTQFWTGLDIRKQVVIGVATLGVFLSVLFAARTSLTPDLALLYSGLDASAAGEVIASLEQQGVTHSVRNGSIYVEQGVRDRLRMVLASEGLPSNGAAGYELLDGLSGFGTTSQMFDAAYWRAKEGELARTISASPGIRAARVHIAKSNPRPFERGSESAASVSVTPNGETLTTAQARALRFLVSSAVPGLTPESVTIIDGRTGMLIEGGGEFGQGSNSDYAVTLRRNVLRLIEAHVGHGNAVVEVSVEHVSDHETLVERRFDPEQRVVVSTESTERTRNNEGGTSGSGNVSVASNLPDGDAAGGAAGAASSSSDSESRELVNFEVSETTREIRKSPGAVKRLSVAVLVNGVETTSDAGELVYENRTAEELEALEQLVASAVGFDAARGDIVTIKSMNMDRSARIADDALPESPSFGSSLDPMGLIQIGVLAAVALVLGLFVIRPIFNQSRPALAGPVAEGATIFGKVSLPGPQSAHMSNHVSNALAPPNQQGSSTSITNQGSGGGQGSSVTVKGSDSGVISDDDFEFPPMAAVEKAFIDPNMMISDGDMPEGANPETHDAVLKLRSLIVSRRTEALEVLRGWLDQEPEPEKETLS